MVWKLKPLQKQKSHESKGSIPDYKNKSLEVKKLKQKILKKLSVPMNKKTKTKNHSRRKRLEKNNEQRIAYKTSGAATLLSLQKTNRTKAIWKSSMLWKEKLVQENKQRQLVKKLCGNIKSYCTLLLRTEEFAKIEKFSMSGDWMGKSGRLPTRKNPSLDEETFKKVL